MKFIFRCNELHLTNVGHNVDYCVWTEPHKNFEEHLNWTLHATWKTSFIMFIAKLFFRFSGLLKDI
jgi:hypothetical protein